MTQSYRPMVRTGSDPKFYGNALRFATREEAQSNADELAGRWTLVVETRVDETDDRVTHRWADGKLHDERISAAPTADFILENHGTILLLKPQTAAAKAWIAEHLAHPETQTLNGGTVIEPRYWKALEGGIAEEGLVVA